ncbi:polygalacturonase isoform X2 [Populus alba x Populus x berolinensis]|nr:polygalacturonase isoform X2 [Populus alba x Populus x berolinensis]
MLQDVVVTGDNGTIDGQGSVWWDWFESHSLNYSRPHLVEFTSSDYVVVSNLTFLNAPAYSIHPVYCSNVAVQNISVSAPGESPYTIGIVPDSSNNVCIEDSRIEVGYDAISVKSGWDEYGIAYDRPTTDVYIRRVYLKSSSGSSVAFGSEMSGGISNVHVEQVHIYNSFSGIEFRTAKGRGGYIKRIIISDVELRNTNTAFGAIGDCGSHPDDNFDPNALPVLDQITLQGVIGSNITTAGNFTGLAESPFTSLCLFNVSLAIRNTLSPWTCSNVAGFSESVSPEPCPELESSSVCYSLLNSYGKSTDI